jgi:hypothetical protein
MEYQKSERHGTRQRPDIVLHVPVEDSDGDVRARNFGAWALKRRASVSEARADFHLLDEMFEVLNYPIGFFVNVDSTESMRQYYEGPYADRLLAVSAHLGEEGVVVSWGHG